MKLHRYLDFIREEFDYEKRQNDILDKISSSGIESLSKSELAFLDAHSKGMDDIQKAYIDIEKDEIKSSGEFEDDYFKFKLEEIEDYKGDKIFYGNLEVNFDRTKDEFYGKFVFNSDGTLNYHLFNPVGSPGGIPTDEDEHYFDNLIATTRMKERLKEFSEDLYKFFTD